MAMPRSSSISVGQILTYISSAMYLHCRFIIDLVFMIVELAGGAVVIAEVFPAC